MKQTATMLIVALCVICAATMMSGCLEVDEPAKAENRTAVKEQAISSTNTGAIIIGSVPPGSEIVLTKEFNGVTTTYDSIIVGDNGEIKLIAPVPGMYTVKTNLYDIQVSVDEDDVICQNIITIS